MSDDLAKRLRETTHMYQVDCELKMKCADRIEELEAKLAKAVEAGQTMDDGCDCERCSKARTTLAELTGGKDE